MMNIFQHTYVTQNSRSIGNIDRKSYIVFILVLIFCKRHSLQKIAVFLDLHLHTIRSRVIKGVLDDLKVTLLNSFKLLSNLMINKNLRFFKYLFSYWITHGNFYIILQLPLLIKCLVKTFIGIF